MKHFIKYFAGLLILAGACDSDEQKPIDIGVDYFPLGKGVYQIYKIDETIYSIGAAPENLNYELMVEIVDSFPNPEGNYTYVIHRKKRQGSSSPWQDLDTWSARGTDRELVATEGNTSFLKLTFPLRKGNTWNGNKYNSLDEDKYRVGSLDESFTAGGTTFEKTLTIDQEDNEDLIVFLDQRKEVYARGVGLIFKEVTQLNYCTADNCRGQQIVESGKKYKQEIIEHGVH